MLLSNIRGAWSAEGLGDVSRTSWLIMKGGASPGPLLLAPGGEGQAAQKGSSSQNRNLPGSGWGPPAASLQPLREGNHTLAEGERPQGGTCFLEVHVSEGGRGKVYVCVRAVEGWPARGGGGGIHTLGKVSMACRLCPLPTLFPSPGSLLSHPSPRLPELWAQ